MDIDELRGALGAQTLPTDRFGEDELYDLRGFSDGDPEEDMDDCGGDFEGWD